ncbi:MAG: SDR family oxidoreductase [Halieaceae bacterium]|jgi:short-subunit dehydrogenase|nr:SDR family oxidoreductase [Halieaceae bacterium]
MDFRQKVVWITGASSGIGEAFALQVARRGARLVLSARNREMLDTVAAACGEAGAHDVLVLPLDVTDYERMGDAVGEVLERFGVIDLLLNNAGVSQRSFCRDTHFDVYRQMMEINVLGQIALTQAVLPSMIERGAGHIAVTASVAGKLGAPLRTGYCAAKHAVMGFFDALRSEVAADGIEVTTITPGFIRTAVAKNALGGDGKPMGHSDDAIEGGMDVTECAAVILRGFEEGEAEIAVGSGAEMALLELKRKDPQRVFRAVEEMAGQLRSAS